MGHSGQLTKNIELFDPFMRKIEKKQAKHMKIADVSSQITPQTQKVLTGFYGTPCII
jgi:hypothetical protein